MPSTLSASAVRRLRESLDAQLSALGEAPFTGDDEAAVAACAEAVLRAEEPLRAAVKAAVRGSLAVLADRAPGRSLEVRVPPHGAVQAVEGPRHTRGTPPGVVETDPLTWLRLATGRIPWAEAVSGHLVRASGARSDLSGHLPLWPVPPPGGAAPVSRH
ncbi:MULTISPECIES: sterol carrier family protein [unclassified Nocardiopsis]|uniref:sterol carrier family protein n=1 Tax=unclassified Nocardiopsis TaxID=2649073 RepID=UPI00135A67D2|nr:MULTISPECIES: sterol carrier family protein [unclassified Nocardiopsis]